jgi:hypothetical protein
MTLRSSNHKVFHGWYVPMGVGLTAVIAGLSAAASGQFMLHPAPRPAPAA